MLLALLLAQAAPADVSLHATVQARSVKVERKGAASIEARAEPEGGSAATSSGNAQGRRFELRIDARIADLWNRSPAAGDPATAPAEAR